MKVCCFLATLPQKTLAAQKKHDRKIETYKNFFRGVKAAGDQAVMITDLRYEPGDAAFMLGWVHEHSKEAPHLRLRQEIADRQRDLGKRVAIADSNLFLFQTPENPQYYLRYSFDGVFPSTGEYCDQNPDPARWQTLQRDMNIEVRDWNTTGQHIVLCLQRDGGWSMRGYSVYDWCIATVQQLRRHTDRPIRIRPHPGDKKSHRYVQQLTRTLVQQGYRNFFISDVNRLTLLQDLEGAWALVNHNSSPAVAAAIRGIPVFSTDITNSQAAEVSQQDLAKIEQPAIFERQQWLNRLAQFHWSHEDLVSGRAWAHMRQWVQT